MNIVILTQLYVNSFLHDKIHFPIDFEALTYQTMQITQILA